MITAQQNLQSPNEYDVYGAVDEAVHLVGVGDLSQMGLLAAVSAAPAPTSTTQPASPTPTASSTTAIYPSQSAGSYNVFEMPQQGLVTLFGVDDLPRMVWNTSEVD